MGFDLSEWRTVSVTLLRAYCPFRFVVLLSLPDWAQPGNEQLNLSPCHYITLLLCFDIFRKLFRSVLISFALPRSALFSCRFVFRLFLRFPSLVARCSSKWKGECRLVDGVRLLFQTGEAHSVEGTTGSHDEISNLNGNVSVSNQDLLTPSAQNHIKNRKHSVEAGMSFKASAHNSNWPSSITR